jgi:hypothetical protein
MTIIGDNASEDKTALLVIISLQASTSVYGTCRR